MGRKRFSFQPWNLPPALDANTVLERRDRIAEGYPEWTTRQIVIAEVVSRLAGEMGLSDSRVLYLTDALDNALNLEQ